MKACGVRLSRLAFCTQQTVSGHCYYHSKLARGIISLGPETVSAIRRGAERELTRETMYADAYARAHRDAEVAEARGRLELREHRIDLEALLLLEAAGDLEAWNRSQPAKGGTATRSRVDQRKRAPRTRVRVWRAV